MHCSFCLIPKHQGLDSMSWSWYTTTTCWSQRANTRFLRPDRKSIKTSSCTRHVQFVFLWLQKSPLLSLMCVENLSLWHHGQIVSSPRSRVLICSSKCYLTTFMFSSRKSGRTEDMSRLPSIPQEQYWRWNQTGPFYVTLAGSGV
jgi:hypothetical protein